MNPTTRAERTTPPAAATGQPTVVAVGGLVLGLVLLIVAFANLDRMPGWAQDYGTVGVYLAFFLYMSIAGRLTWWGIDTLRDQTKTRRERR